MATSISSYETNVIIMRINYISILFCTTYPKNNLSRCHLDNVAVNDNSEEITCCSHHRQQQLVADRVNMFLMDPHSLLSAGGIFLTLQIKADQCCYFKFLIMSHTANMASQTEDDNTEKYRDGPRQQNAKMFSLYLTSDEHGGIVGATWKFNLDKNHLCI